MFEIPAKIAAQPISTNAHGLQVVEVNFREFRMTEELVHQRWYRNNLVDRVPDAMLTGSKSN